MIPRCVVSYLKDEHVNIDIEENEMQQPVSTIQPNTFSVTNQLQCHFNFRMTLYSWCPVWGMSVLYETFMFPQNTSWCTGDRWLYYVCVDGNKTCIQLTDLFWQFLKLSYYISYILHIMFYVIITVVGLQCSLHILKVKMQSLHTELYLFNQVLINELILS